MRHLQLLPVKLRARIYTHTRLCRPLLVHGNISLLSTTGPTATSTDYSPRVGYSTASSSVEAFASTFFPLAVDHYTDDDEEDAAQQGE